MISRSKLKPVQAAWVSLRRSGVQALVALLPKLGHAVVSGFPDEEGNAVEVVRVLARRWSGGVYWLVGGDPVRLSWTLEDASGGNRVRIVGRRTLRGLLLYATARIVFFTHGLYSSPSPPSNATFVNLWHGDGPKRTANPSFHPKVPASYMVAGTSLWGSKRAAFFGLKEEQLLVTGHPRIDQFCRPASDLAMRRLGLDPQLPLILWLPTYRETNTPGMLHWRDAPSLLARSDVRALIASVATQARQASVAFIAKPHVLDADHLRDLGIATLASDELHRFKVGLYQLLARTSGLITDYSSVWTDYLALKRPMGFFCPDLAEYSAGRGLSVDDLPSLLPGPLLSTADEFLEFMVACVSTPGKYQSLRENSIRRIGAETRRGATNRLLDHLKARGVEKILDAR